MESLKGWWKQLLAKNANRFAPYEWGGVLFDYKNGQLEELHRWGKETTPEEVIKSVQNAWEIVRNMTNAGRDAVYLAVVKVGVEQGYFVVHDSNRGWWERHFHPKHYNFHDAYVETLMKCREIADGMGFRREVK